MSHSNLRSALPREAKFLLEEEDAFLVDVREPSEHASGRIPASTLAPLNTLEASAAQWNRERPVLIYCQSGRRGEKALEILGKLGFSRVVNLDGGFSAWNAAGFPAEKTTGAPWSLERQVRFTVGLFVILFTSLGLWLHSGFLALNFLIAAGLIFSAITNTCGLALVLAKLPWNRKNPS